MDQKDFDNVKQGFKEAKKLLRGKVPKGTTADSFKIHHK